MQTCASLSDLAAASKHIVASRVVLSDSLRRIVLSTPEIEVWQVQLDPCAASVLQCAELLSDDERSRAHRFHVERDRRRFIVARGMLRIVLGNCLEVPPAIINFGYTIYGKPYLAGSKAQIHFNVSHSEERALYAVSRSCCLGVDIEYLNRSVDYNGLAKRFFTADECATLQSLPESRRQRAFLACWTRKEAVVKATGDGLALPLNQFEVTVAADTAPRVLGFAARTHNVVDWALYSANTDNDYYATVAAYRG